MCLSIAFSSNSVSATPALLLRSPCSKTLCQESPLFVLLSKSKTVLIKLCSCYSTVK